MKKKFLFMFLLLTISFVSYGETIKILAIGNSFSEDAVENYLYSIGHADGVEFIIGNMYIGGCSLETHWNNANNNNANYDYRKIVNGVKKNTANTKLETAILDEDWDYISFQQVSQNSGMYNTYFPYITNLQSYVKSKATNPNVQYALHMTWAYQQNSTHSGFANYGKDQITMYDAILDATTRVANQENINIIVPSGTAIQNARTSYLGDNLCRDGYHLDVNVGRFTAACTWYEKITGNNVMNNTYVPVNISERNAKVAKQSAHYAVQSPLDITNINVELAYSKGNFNGWNLMAAGNDGLNAGGLTYSENNMTIEAWLYIDDASGSNKEGVNVMSNRHTGNQGFSVNLQNNSATSKEDVRFVFKNTKHDGTYDQAFAMFLPREPYSNQWRHFAFVISSDDQKAYAYLNGELYDVVEDFYTSWVGNRPNDQLWIGRWYPNDPTFYGKMADIRLWTVARTAEEIAENYNQGLKGDEEGLYLYYDFDDFDQSIINIANPGTNNGSLLPANSWKEVHSQEILSAKPTNLSLFETSISWDGTADNFEIEIIETLSGDVVKIDETTANSYALEDLEENKAYDVSVRAFTTLFYSDWATLNTKSGETGLKNPYAHTLNLRSGNNSIIVWSDSARLVDVYGIDGSLIRTVNLNVGTTTINHLPKGVYLIDNQKILVK